jgi:hypothetical protein
MSFSTSVLIEHVDEPILRKILNKFLDGPKKELFKVYHHLFEKSYDLNSEEGIRR